MSSWTFWKVFCDVSACFAVLSGFPSAFSYDGMLLWPALLCAAAAGLAAHFRDTGKDALGFACATLPLALLLPGMSVHIWILLPAVIYTVAVILRGSLSLEYYTFRRYFRLTLTGLGCLAAALWVMSYLDRPMDGIENFDGEAVLRMGIAHAVAGVMLLRQLRLGMEGSAAVNRRQSMLLFGGTGAVMLGFVAMEKWLHLTLMAILRTLLSIVLSPMQLLVDWFAEEGRHFMESLGSDSWAPQQPAPEYTMPPLESVPPAAPEPQPVESTFPWIALVVTVAVVIVLVLMLRTFHSSGGKAVSQHTEEALETGTTRRKDRSSNRSKLRRCYREFLRYERKRGLALRRYHTSLDVQKRLTVDTDPQAASQLRQLYLSARYDPHREVTAEQVRQARAALKKIRGY